MSLVYLSLKGKVADVLCNIYASVIVVIWPSVGSDPFEEYNIYNSARHYVKDEGLA